MKDIVKLLEEIINQNLNDLDLPHVKGNSIRIRHMVVRKSPKGYLVYNTKDNVQVARTFCKTSAIAIARTCAQGKNYVKEIMRYDQIIEKNYNDSIFYKNTLRRTKDEFKKDVIEIRFWDARDRTLAAKESLDNIIFG